VRRGHAAEQGASSAWPPPLVHVAQQRVRRAETRAEICTPQIAHHVSDERGFEDSDKYFYRFFSDEAPKASPHDPKEGYECVSLLNFAMRGVDSQHAQLREDAARNR
jgi:hypothetical protein